MRTYSRARLEKDGEERLTNYISISIKHRRVAHAERQRRSQHGHKISTRPNNDLLACACALALALGGWVFWCTVCGQLARTQGSRQGFCARHPDWAHEHTNSCIGINIFATHRQMWDKPCSVYVTYSSILCYRCVICISAIARKAAPEPGTRCVFKCRWAIKTVLWVCVCVTEDLRSTKVCSIVPNATRFNDMPRT